MEFLRSLHRQFPHLGLAEARLLHAGETPDADVRTEAGKRGAPDVPDAPEPNADSPERTETDVRKEAKDRNARTEGTKEEQMEQVKQDLGKRIAGLRDMPELVKQELQSFNRNVAHPHGFHASITNGRLDFGEYRAPVERQPSALDNKIAKTAQELNRINWEIHILLGRGRTGNGLTRAGAEYRAQMGSARSRYNRTPEINLMLARLSAQEIEAYGPKLGQLMKERVKVTEELSHLQALKRSGLPLDESTDTTTTTSSDGQSIDFQASEGPTTKFDLEQSLKNVDPQTAEAIRALPKEIQEAAVTVVEGMSEAELAEARTTLESVAKMPADVLSAFGKLIGPDGSIKLPEPLPTSATPDTPMGKAIEFIKGMTPSAKAFLEKVMGAAVKSRNSVTVTTKEAGDVADKATIARLVKLRREAKTETDIDVAEGLLMMQGVDLDKSDIDGGKIVMADKDVRPFLYLFGFIRFIKGVIDKAFGKKGGKGEKGEDIKGPGGKGAEGPRPAGEMTPEERRDELKSAKEGIEKAKKKEGELADDIKSLEKQKENPDTKAEAKPKIDEEIAQKKKDLEALKKTREELEARVKELEGAGDKPADKKEGGDTKPDVEKLKKDIDEILKANLPEKTAKDVIGAIKVELNGEGKIVVSLDQGSIAAALLNPVIGAINTNRFLPNVDTTTGKASSNPMNVAEFERFISDMKEVAAKAKAPDKPPAKAGPPDTEGSRPDAKKK